MGYVLPALTFGLGVPSPNVFIETGTYLGGVPQLIMDNYKDLFYRKLYTIELGDWQAKTAAYRYKLYEKFSYDNSHFDKHTKEQVETLERRTEYFNGRLTLINGDSSECLSEVLSEVDEQALIWLDAHAGAQKYARGVEDVPLFKELEAIKNHHIKNHIIAIDDAHLFGKVQYSNNPAEKNKPICDYSHVTPERVSDQIKDINPNYQTGIANPFGHAMFIGVVK